MNYDVIKDIIYTEKSNKALSDYKYYFKVDSSCNKVQLKSVVKSLFGVDVEMINMVNVNGKSKRFKGILGKKRSYKKAIVTIKSGQSINFQNLR